MAIELKPCPFCGEPFALEYEFCPEMGRKWGRVACGSCGSCGPDVRTDYKDVAHWARHAADAWNGRFGEPLVHSLAGDAEQVGRKTGQV
jgi:hypothetical protein